MHLYASTHKVHSDALAFLRIQAHSDAFTHTRSQGECRPPKGLAQLQDSCMHSYAFVCTRMYSHAFVYIRLHSYALSCILMLHCVSLFPQPLIRNDMLRFHVAKAREHSCTA